MALTEKEEIEMLELEIELEESGSSQEGRDGRVETEDRGFAKTLLEEGPRVGLGIAGSIAATGRAVAAIPHPAAKFAGGVVAGAAGAFAGGTLGEGATQTIQTALDMPEGPNSTDEVIQRLWHAGKEEAIAEAGGQVAFKLIGRAFSPLRGKAAEGIDELRKMFGKYGGKFTAAQQTESWLVHQLDGLTRGSLTGSGVMKKADALNNKALLSWQDDLSSQIAGSASKNLSDREFGELVVNTIQGGKAAHSSSVGAMYSKFDELFPTSVNMGGMKGIADELSAKIRRISGIGDSELGKDFLSKVGGLDDNISFSDAQYLRSTLLDIQRGVKANPAEAKLAKNIGMFVEDITKSMDNAAAVGGKESLSKYQSIKKFANSGYKSFNDDFIVKLLKNGNKESFEKVGEQLFRDGNASEIIKLKRALRKASFFGKKEGKAASYDESWGQIKQSYLENVMTKSMKEAELGAGETMKDFMTRSKTVGADKLLKRFTDQKKGRTLQAVLNKKESEAVFSFLKTAARVQSKSSGGLGMVMQLAQGSAIVGLATGHADKAEVIPLFAAPAVLARMMTNPIYTRLLIKGLTTKKSSLNAGGVVAQLSTLIQDVEDEIGGEQPKTTEENLKTIAENPL